eukprot:NODE_7243_length_1596_cov_9.103472.p1 GENE.NODE_7243_length_1596_cov_9.103472~~NODE_7243_length_1596_cov_9.103472.p1  ORF type:complete len:417 (-),score=105.78 NODE_7243_length_1596_cov_9.103472:276-1526(-)
MSSHWMEDKAGANQFFDAVAIPFFRGGDPHSDDEAGYDCGADVASQTLAGHCQGSFADLSHSGGGDVFEAGLSGAGEGDVVGCASAAGDAESPSAAPEPPRVLCTSIASCVSELANAEALHGVSSLEVEVCIARLSAALECHGRGAEAVPLWLHAAELEAQRLGPDHNELRPRLERAAATLELRAPELHGDAAKDYAVRLRRLGAGNPEDGCEAWSCIADPDWKPGADSGAAWSDWAPSAETAAAIGSTALSLGGTAACAAASVGGRAAVVAGSVALRTSFSAATGACSVTTGAASQTAGLTASYVAGAAAGPLGLGPVAQGLLEGTAGCAGRAAGGAAASLALVTVNSTVDTAGALVSAGEVLVASGAAGALAHAGQAAVGMVAHAAWGIMCSACSRAEPAVEAARVPPDPTGEG